MTDNVISMPQGEASTSTAALRARLLADADEAAALPGIDVAALHALRAKLADKIFNLVVAGEFKRGKSSVVNALLHADVLPTGVVPLTSIVTVLRHGDSPKATVTFEDDRRETTTLERLSEFVTERGNPKNAKRVREVEVSYPAPWLGQGFRLADTPGIGSAYRHNTDVTYDYLPQSDAVIFVASVEQPVSRSEIKFLNDIRAYAGRIFCLLNKIDHLSASELKESVAFSTAALREALGADVPVFPVSARLAITARSDKGDAWTESGFAAFDKALRQFLQRDSGSVWIDCVRHHFARLLAGCRLTAELELEALAAPLEKLDQNLHAFDAKKTETMQARSDLDALLESDTRKLIRDRIEPDIAAFKRQLAGRLQAELQGWFEEARMQHETSLEEELERHIVDEVRRAFDSFREQEDSTVNVDFDRICDRFWQRIQAATDELMRYSAELFSIRFRPVEAAPLRQARSRFYYKFWQEPPTLLLLGSAMTRLLPGPFARPLILRRAKRRV
ncbi:MAG: dynamin family protein, partial [Rhodanobacteraceae bacterium]